MIPDGFNQNHAVECPTCGAPPWRNCVSIFGEQKTPMEWFEVHAVRAEKAAPVVAAW